MSDPVGLTTADRAAIRAELRRDARLMAYLKALRRLPEEGAARRILFAASHTVRTLDPYVRVEAELASWRLEPRYVEYAQWQHALIAGQGADEPDAYVLSLHYESLLSGAGGRASAMVEAEEAVATVLRSFRARTKAPLFVLHLPPPRPIGAVGFGKGGNLRRIDAAIELGHRVAALAAGLEATYLVDLSATPQVAGNWQDDKGLYASLSPVASHAAPLIAQAVARAIAPLFRPRRKVLVLDLDNTLWGGIVGEVGSEGVQLGEGWPGAAYLSFQREVRELAESGVLLALNSKNNEADARAVFDTRPEMILRWSDFAARRVNWQDKAENLASIAAELSLGIDSFVFADDSPVECARIGGAFPEVEVVHLPDDPARLTDALLNCPGFDVLNLTDEDRRRTESYRSETARGALRETTGDYPAFLRSLSLEIAIAPSDDGSFERLHQLLLKTNQFHLTLERPTQTELAARRGRLFSVRLRDRFGDYGIIGVLEAVVRQDAVEIVNLALSCRALGRLVEETVLAFVAELARAAGAAALTARAVAGPRNQPALDFLAKAGFAPVGEQLFRLPISPAAPAYPEEAAVTRPTPAMLEGTW